VNPFGVGLEWRKRGRTKRGGQKGKREEDVQNLSRKGTFDSEEMGAVRDGGLLECSGRSKKKTRDKEQGRNVSQTHT